MSISQYDWQQAPEDVLPVLTQANESFLALFREPLPEFPLESIKGLIYDITMHRQHALTPLKKQNFTIFLQYLLNQITKNHIDLNIDHIIYSKFYDEQPSQRHLDQNMIHIPTLILSGRISFLHENTNEQCGLNPLQFLQLCHFTYTLIQKKTDDHSVISTYFNQVIAILKEGKNISAPIPEKERYQAYIAFLYRCFDTIVMQPEHVRAVEHELIKAKYRAQIKLPYIENEYRNRNKREIQHQELAEALHTYRSESWVGWIFNTLLCGLFGKHQSYTIAALNTLLQQNQAFYSEAVIREIVQKSEPQYAEHRLGFFAQFTETTCGTDNVLRKIDAQMVCRM